MPKFSVITPAYNCGPFLQQCIDSVLAQNYPDFEQIIVDGGSKDETVEILKRNKHVRWVSEPDDGEADALNKAMKMVTGDIVQWLNADDWMEPGVFARVAEVMNPAAGRHVVYGRTNMADGAGKHLYVKNSDPNMSLGLLLRWWDSRRHPHQPSCFYSVPMMRELGPFRQDMTYSIDYEYWLRMIVKYKFTYLDLVMSTMRNREDSKSIYIESASAQIYSHWEVSIPYHQYLSFQDRIALWRDYYNIVVSTHANHWFRDQVIVPPITREAVMGLALVLSNNPNQAKTEDLAGFIFDHYLESPGARTLGHASRVSSLGRPVIAPVKYLPGDIQRPRVFIDWAGAGIAPDSCRLFKTLLRQWSTDEFAKSVLVLDRGGAAPKFPGIRYQDAPVYNRSQPQPDRRMLQAICDRLGADLFVTLSETTPLTAHSTVLVCDEIPVPVDPARQVTITPAQQRIRQASSFIVPSMALQAQLQALYPQINPRGILVIPHGVGEEFRPRSAEEIEALRRKLSISKPSFLIVGPCGDNPNTRLVLEALGALPDADQVQVLCAAATGPAKELDGLLGSVQLALANLTDDELAAAYSGARALLHVGSGDLPSLTALEAMTCGCPIIAWPTDTLIEIAGDAALFVKRGDVEGVTKLLQAVGNPDERGPLVQRGQERAAKHSAGEMALRVKDVFIRTVMALEARPAART
jgi:glycosyltransferase involved in cell wall biosynthesis